MIIFRTIRWKNLLSTGDIFTEISLDKNRTTLIVGENGAGKSTMLDALSFCLYGKPFRKINKPQLVNTINKKDLLVEVNFNIHKDEYMIRRGMKPNVFEIHKNGEIINQNAAAKDYQEILEKDILKLNFKSFGQIVVLGSSTFVPFMQLSAGNRREVIEDLLDIQIFTKMAVLLKERSDKNKSLVQNSSYSIDLLEQSIQNSKDYNKSISSLLDQEEQQILSEIEESSESLNDLKEKYLSIKSERDSLNIDLEAKSNAEKNILDCERQILILQEKIKSLQQDIAFFNDNDVCSMCSQGIEHDHAVRNITEYKKDVETHSQAIEIIKKKKKEFHEIFDGASLLQSEYSSLNLELSRISTISKTIIANLKALKTKHKNFKTKFINQELKNVEDLEEDHSEAVQRHSMLVEQREIIASASSLLKDGGIKTQIIKQYVPVINKLINKYLADMDFFVQFELDEVFSETIKSRHRDAFSYESFSEGEKVRIDMALLFTWRAVSKMRNSISTNLLIMDEIFDGSLDSTGTDEFIKILLEITGDSNIFVISHKTDKFVENFDETLKFDKIKNFSQLV